MREEIERLYELKGDARSDAARRLFAEFRDALTAGRIRAAEKVSGEWRVNAWVKKGILLGFRLGELAETGEALSFVDKDTYPVRRFTAADKVRIVPGGSSVRSGAYVAASVVCMPPMYINAGRVRGRRHHGGLARAGGIVRAGRQTRPPERGGADRRRAGADERARL